MRIGMLVGAAILLASTGALAQEIVKVPAKDAPTVARPDDLFGLPPGQWQFAKQLWEGQEACTAERCEAGFTSGDLVVSAEHSGEFVRIIAGYRTCPSVGFSEVEVGKKPGKRSFKSVTKQIERVVKGLSKTCGVAAVPALPQLDTSRLFPGKQES